MKEIFEWGDLASHSASLSEGFFRMSKTPAKLLTGVLRDIF